MPFDPRRPYNELPDLPPATDVETPAVLRETIRATRLLAELKGSLQRLPNPSLLLNSLVLHEGRESSAIENIVTTQDEVYRAFASPDELQAFTPEVKEVLRYREAMYAGLEELERTGGVVTMNLLVRVMQTLRATRDDVRRVPGVRLANSAGEVIYSPPEGEDLIRARLQALERFMAEPPAGMDALVAMALAHYQFEAIHPFTDGNGRTGRIVNVLYLVQQGLLTFPAVYLSAFVNEHRTDYYRGLRGVTERGEWEAWVLFMIRAVADTSAATLSRLGSILDLQAEALAAVRTAAPRAPARELVDLMFTYPYLKIRVLETAGIAKRQTASVYLHALAGAGLLNPLKAGREVYFVNQPLFDLLRRPLDAAGVPA